MTMTTAERERIAEAKARARIIFIEARGRLAGKSISAQLKAEGYGHISSTAINRWKKVDKWEIGLAPVEVSAVQRAARSRELQDLIAEKGGELLVFEGVYAEMLLGAASVAQKLLAWAEGVDPSTLKADDALAMMKALPALVDKTVGLKDTLSDLKFRGATDTSGVSSTPSDVIHGEIMPPEPKPAPVETVHPALSDALASVIRAKKTAPAIKKDVAPKARASIRT